MKTVTMVHTRPGTTFEADLEGGGEIPRYVAVAIRGGADDQSEVYIFLEPELARELRDVLANAIVLNELERLRKCGTN